MQLYLQEIGNGAKERVTVTVLSCEGDLEAILSLLRERSPLISILCLVWGALLSRVSCVKREKRDLGVVRSLESFLRSFKINPPPAPVLLRFN